MGLSAFSRMRVSMLPEMELEAKRFEEWNEAHQKGFRDADALHDELTSDKKLEAIRKASEKGVKTIGEKVVAGLQENVEDTEDSIDQKMREDHVRDMVGRRHVVDPQGEPLSITERLHGRVPDSGTASEAMIAFTDVEGEGPTKEMVDAAQAEQQPWAPPDEADAPPPPAQSAKTGGAAAAKKDEPAKAEHAKAREPEPAKKK
jgi:hypothetical protein